MNERAPDVGAALAAGEALWSAGVAARAAWLAEAFRTLADPGSPLGRRARDELPATSGLSAPMVEWGLAHALGDLTFENLVRVAHGVPLRGVRVRPGRLCALVLAGNVFTAAARAALWPLLLGWPVVAKASRDDAGFPALLAEALGARFPHTFQVATLAPGEELDTLLAQADAVSVYGGDATVRSVRGQIDANASFQAHGHGLGAGYIARAVDAAQHDALARAFALDVAAYDQRGCMSPHALWIEGDADAFAARLHEALGALENTLPRGPVPFDTLTAQRRYRDHAALGGTLHEGRTHAVSVERSFRPSPGQRNVQVIAVAQRSEFLAQIAPFAAHLKCLGVAGATAHELAPHFPTRVAPRVCALGHMQTPPLDALSDGYPPWEGLVRSADC